MTVHVHWWWGISDSMQWGKPQSLKCWLTQTLISCIPPVNTVPHGSKAPAGCEERAPAGCEERGPSRLWWKRPQQVVRNLAGCDERGPSRLWGKRPQQVVRKEALADCDERGLSRLWGKRTLQIVMKEAPAGCEKRGPSRLWGKRPQQAPGPPTAWLACITLCLKKEFGDHASTRPFCYRCVFQQGFCMSIKKKKFSVNSNTCPTCCRCVCIGQDDERKSWMIMPTPVLFAAGV